SGVSKKFKHRSSVVLPLPEEPMMARACPSSRSKLISSSTLVAPKCFSMLCTSKTAMWFPSLSAEIAQLLLNPAKQQGQRPVKDQVVDPGEEQGPNQAGVAVGALDEGVTGPDDLLQRDD